MKGENIKMSYEMVNKELNIKFCSLADLTMEQDTFNILEKDKFFPKAQEMAVLQEIRDRKQDYNVDWLMVDAFHYGFIRASGTKEPEKLNEPRAKQEKIAREWQMWNGLRLSFYRW